MVGPFAFEKFAVSKALDMHELLPDSPSRLCKLPREVIMSSTLARNSGALVEKIRSFVSNVLHICIRSVMNKLYFVLILYVD